MANNSEILLTDDTRALVGEDVLAFLQRQDVKPDLILSRNDFESNGFFDAIAKDARVSSLMQQAGIARLTDLASNGLYGEDFYDEGTTTTDISPVHIDLRNIFKENATEENSAYTSFVNEFVKSNKNELEGLGYEVKDLLKSRGNHDIYVVTYPTITSPAEFFLKATKIPEDKLSPLIHNLSLKDFNTYTLFHEVGHTAPKQTSMIRAEQELNGDLHANDLYKKAYAQGIVHDTNIPEVVSYMRAIGSFIIYSDKYAYNGSIDPDQNIDHITHSKYDNRPYAFLKNSVNEVYASIGKPLQNAETEFKALSNLNKDFFSPEQVKEYKRLSFLDEPPLEDMEAFMAKIEIPEDQQIKYEKDLQFKNVLVGMEMEEDQPELTYEAAKAELIAGRFDNDPAAKNQVENFVIGAERIAPDYFKIEGTPYLDYLKTIGRDENLTSGLTPPPSQVATNDLGTAYTL